MISIQYYTIPFNPMHQNAIQYCNTIHHNKYNMIKHNVSQCKHT